MKNFIEITPKYFNQGSEKWDISNNKNTINVNYIFEVFENGFNMAVNYQDVPIRIHTVEDYETLKTLIKQTLN